MKTIENNLPALKALCDDQARHALEMYKIMKSCYLLADEMHAYEKHGERASCLHPGIKQIKANIVEYICILDKVADGCVPLSNMR